MISISRLSSEVSISSYCLQVSLFILKLVSVVARVNFVFQKKLDFKIQLLNNNRSHSQTLVQYNVVIFRHPKHFMISSNDFRSGVTIELDGSVWRVVEFLHVKPGKGSAFVRTKLKNVQSGSVVERTFRAGETVPQATIEKRTMQHTYKEAEQYVFMDMETFEEASLRPEQLGDRTRFLKEGMEVNILFWNGQVLEVELPTSVILEITETDPGVKGDTATGGSKPAIVETGAQVMVPLFISVGERIKIDTRDGSYLGRE